MRRMLSMFLTIALLFSTVCVFAEEVKTERIKIGLTSTVMKVGETQKMIISITPTNAAPELEYESDKPEVVTAAVGTLIAKSEGVANITVRVRDSEIKDTVQLTVSGNLQDGDNSGANSDDNENSNQEIKINKIEVENKTIYLERYETERIVYSVYPENARNNDVTFKSSNTTIATVDERGYVYAKRNGNTTIKIQTEDGKVLATVKVYISQYDEDDDYDSILRNIYITYDDEILKDKFEVMEKNTVQLGIKASPSSANKKVNWRSSNKKIATVDNSGKVTGVSPGTCTVYATSTTSSSKKDSITIVVTDYVRYPDKITIKPQENSTYETGELVYFTATLYPEDTTEKEITWSVSGGGIITQNGVLKITDGGEIIVKAHSKNHKTVGEYKFSAIYGTDHFTQVGGAYNLLNDRCIEMYFDTDVNAYSGQNNIFATCDVMGNGDKLNISVKTAGKKLSVNPNEKWPDGDVYIFIKEFLCDINGNVLGKNLKYKLNVRGDVYAE